MSKPSDTPPTYRIEDLDLHLRYRHGLGGQTPFFESLAKGTLLASRCPKCGDCRCPPRLICPSDRASALLFVLSGEGTLVRTTIGPANSLIALDEKESRFGEVAPDGVGNRVFARILRADQKVSDNCRVRLVTPNTEPRHPIQSLVFQPV